MQYLQCQAMSCEDYDIRAFNSLIYILLQNKVISALENAEIRRLFQKRVDSITTVSNAALVAEIFKDELDG